MNPEASIILPVYNCENYLKECIDSILNQSFTNFELMIINDASTDNTLEIIKNYDDPRIKIINNETNLGVCKSFNAAVPLTKSDLIFRIDGDDICKKNKLKIQVDFMNRNPNIVVLGSNADIISMDGRFLSTTNLPATNNDIKKNIAKKATFINPTTVFRKNAFVLAGGYYEPIKQSFEDFILWNRLKTYGDFYILPDSLLFYRIVKNSLSNHNFSFRYKFYEQKVAQRGYATDKELQILNYERAKVRKYSNPELSYTMIIANYLVKTNPRLARTMILKSLQKKQTFFGFKILIKSFLNRKDA